MKREKDSMSGGFSENNGGRKRNRVPTNDENESVKANTYFY